MAIKGKHEYVMYMLVATDADTCTRKDTTYVGVTKYLHNRLRQHNGLEKGGAKYTKGRNWKYVCFVAGFPYGKIAKQYEARMKKNTPIKKGGCSLIKRCKQLCAIMQMEKVYDWSIENKKLNLTIYWADRDYPNRIKQECLERRESLRWPTNICHKLMHGPTNRYYILANNAQTPQNIQLKREYELQKKRLEAAKEIRKAKKTERAKVKDVAVSSKKNMNKKAVVRKEGSKKCTKIKIKIKKEPKWP